MEASSLGEGAPLYVAVVAKDNHPGLKYVPEKIVVPGSGDSSPTKTRTVELSRVDPELKFHNKNFSYGKVGGLLYFPPGETDTLDRLWPKLNVPWMHCFL